MDVEPLNVNKAMMNPNLYAKFERWHLTKTAQQWLRWMQNITRCLESEEEDSKESLFQSTTTLLDYPNRMMNLPKGI